MSNQAGAISLFQRLQRAQLRLAALALIIMMLVTVCDVVMRYLFNRPISGSYDLVESMLVVFVFQGLPAVFLGRQNIAIDVIDSMIGRYAVTTLIRLADLVSLAVLAILAWAMITPALQAYAYGDRKLELGLPLYVLWIVALVGMAGAMLCVIALLFSRVLPGRAQAPE